jgi:ADP-heptose:LPS heptosyltransferase
MNIVINKEAQLRVNPERILVWRDGALGDVILTTPVVRRLRETYPAAVITVATWYPEVFANNPAVNFVVTPANAAPELKFDRVINLNLVYESRPWMHIVHAYMQFVFGDTGEEWDLQQRLYTVKPGAKYFSHGDYVIVHPSVAGWANRTLPQRTWLHVCDMLKIQGYQPVCVGSPRDILPGQTTPAFWVRDIHAHMQLYRSAACFVGSDSALLHVAGATEVPIVGVFTCVRPQYRLPIRHHQIGWNCEVVMPDLPCLGCQERAPPPSTTESCERGDRICVQMVEARHIVQAVMHLMERVDAIRAT